MIAAFEAGVAQVLHGQAGWGAARLLCTCGFRDSAFGGNRQIAIERLGARCRGCGDIYAPPNRKLRTKLEEVIDAGRIDAANKLLRRLGERVEAVKALAVACSHCGKPLVEDESLAAVKALLRILDDPPDGET